MPDGLQRQLEAFGATLESSTGEPVRASDHGRPVPDRSQHRSWAIAGAAACLVAVVVGLVAVTGRDAEAPSAQLQSPTSTSDDTLPGSGDSSGLGAFEPLLGVGAVVEATVVGFRGPQAVANEYGGVDYPGRSEDAAEWTTPFGLPVIILGDAELLEAIGGSERADAVATDVRAAIDAGKDIEVSAPVGVYREGERYELWLGSDDFGYLAYLAFDDSGATIDGLAIQDADSAYARLSRHTGDGRLASLAAMARELNAVRGGAGQGDLMDFVFGPDETTSDEQSSDRNESSELDPASEQVPDDPLALERDGWTLVERTSEPFVGGELPCEAAQGLTDFDGVASVHDILTAPEGTGLEVDVQVLDVGSVERGNRLAEVLTSIGRCAAEAQGVTGETGAMSSIRASWFRAGPDFALVAIVGEGSRSVVLEIEGAAFDDDLIGELAHRADQFLRGATVATGSPSGEISVNGGSSVGESQLEPAPGQVKLWVSNQSFEDDPVAITVAIDGQVVVDDTFAVEGQHNWFSFMIDGLEPGRHALTATSDTGVEFAGTFTLPADEPRWMVVDYWHSPDDAEGPHFTFDVTERPIVFS